MNKQGRSAASMKALNESPVKGIKVVDYARFETLFENASDAFMVVDLNSGKITSINHATLELTGYTRSEIENADVRILENKSGVIQLHAKNFSHEFLGQSGVFEDVVISRRDGYPRYVTLSVKVLEYKKERLAMCVVRDVTEKKNMERDLITKHNELRAAVVELEKANAELKAMQDTLVQSGKLAALGELAAGIAHEINQPLTAIKGFAQETKSITKENDTAQDYLSEIVKNADKMSKIISHLRTFTRKSTEDFAWSDIHEVIDESLVMLGSQFKSHGIKVVKNYSGKLPQVYCNASQLEQVFINLATNARDAIDAQNTKDGVITITTTQESEGIVEVSFEDNGVGIPESVRQKIYNPFFTTKEVGKGMGLGLSISYGILSKINASIMVESAPGKGAKFRIKLPVDYRKH